MWEMLVNAVRQLLEPCVEWGKGKADCGGYELKSCFFTLNYALSGFKWPVNISIQYL